MRQCLKLGEGKKKYKFKCPKEKGTLWVNQYVKADTKKQAIKKLKMKKIKCFFSTGKEVKKFTFAGD